MLCQPVDNNGQLERNLCRRVHEKDIAIGKHLVSPRFKPDVHDIKNWSEISREKKWTITFEQFDQMIIAIGQFFLHPKSRIDL